MGGRGGDLGSAKGGVSCLQGDFLVVLRVPGVLLKVCDLCRGGGGGGQCNEDGRKSQKPTLVC